MEVVPRHYCTTQEKCKMQIIGNGFMELKDIQVHQALPYKHSYIRIRVSTNIHSTKHIRTWLMLKWNLQVETCKISIFHWLIVCTKWWYYTKTCKFDEDVLALDRKCIFRCPKEDKNNFQFDNLHLFNRSTGFRVFETIQACGTSHTEWVSHQFAARGVWGVEEEPPEADWTIKRLTIIQNFKEMNKWPIIAEPLGSIWIKEDFKLRDLTLSINENT